MTDIVERLQTDRPWCYDSNDQMFEYVDTETADEAAAEIKRLRGVVNVLADKLARYTGRTVPDEMRIAEAEVSTKTGG